ncbi:hypothetical protein LSH36_1588g00024 [Paralvinella palmiformis]|uniref:Uncharacterized protein n=1 Tax=Paralvinella palmiformis TaxID=53620 RepID=A0AAD9ISQ0_9ANNE|nr:hypothetical protein LSH36_1588g00024 [Paralvinella palmiformis]
MHDVTPRICGQLPGYCLLAVSPSTEFPQYEIYRHTAYRQLV